MYLKKSLRLRLQLHRVCLHVCSVINEWSFTSDRNVLLHPGFWGTGNNQMLNSYMLCTIFVAEANKQLCTDGILAIFCSLGPFGTYKAMQNRIRQ